ncbi:hypothetical protein ACQ4PT_060735 [Festuca glaucescens]
MDSGVPPPRAQGVAQPQLLLPFVPPHPAASGFVDVPVGTAATPKQKWQSPHVAARGPAVASSAPPTKPQAQARPKLTGGVPPKMKWKASNTSGDPPPRDFSTSHRRRPPSSRLTDAPATSSSRGAPALFVNMLESSAVDIDSSPLHAFDKGYEEGEEIQEVEDKACEEAVATGIKAVGASKWSSNYTEKEDIALLNAWESVSLDAVTGNDQSGMKYWQRIDDKLNRLRPKTSDGSSRTIQSMINLG